MSYVPIVRGQLSSRKTAVGPAGGRFSFQLITSRQNMRRSGERPSLPPPTLLHSPQGGHQKHRATDCTVGALVHLLERSMQVSVIEPRVSAIARGPIRLSSSDDFGPKHVFVQLLFLVWQSLWHLMLLPQGSMHFACSVAHLSRQSAAKVALDIKSKRNARKVFTAHPFANW